MNEMSKISTRSGAIYVRVSTDKQDELSPDAQIRMCKEYAQKNNIHISPEHIYEEHGISGKMAQKRPAFLRMIANARSKQHPFDIIILWKFSRFARNQEEAIVYKSLLRKESQVEVISISEPLAEGPFGSLNERIIEWMDEYYSVNLATEVKRGMEEKALRGGYQMTPCLGYTAVGRGKAYKIVEEEYQIYQYICDQFDYNCKKPAAIAKDANNLGYRTKRGNLFEARTIQHLLMNPFYTGEIRWNGHTYQGTHEVRMDKDRFEKRIARMTEMKKKPKHREISCCRHWLGGIVKCPVCGASLSYNSSASPNTPPFFQCWKYQKGIHRESVSISEKKLTRSILLNFEHLLQQQDHLLFRYLPSHSENQTELQYLRKQLERIYKKEQRIQTAYENEIDTLEEYRNNKARLHQEKTELILKMNTTKNLLETTEESPLMRIQTVYDVISDPDVNYMVKGTFLRSVVEKIIYDKEQQTLVFHFCNNNLSL